MLHFYSLGYAEVMALPLKEFWLMHKNIDRITAERDLKTMMLLCSVNSPEALEAHDKALRDVLGKVAEYDKGKVALADAVYDRAGLLQLKDMASSNVYSR